MIFVAWVSCAPEPPEASAPEPVPVAPRVAPVYYAGDLGPLRIPWGDAACECAVLSSCQVVERVPVGPKTRSDGLYRRNGQVRCDNVAIDCGELGPSATIVRVTDDCGLWGDKSIVAGDEVLLIVPRSVGASGGAAYTVEVADADASTFVPPGLNFARDRGRILHHGQVVDVDDPASFELLDCPGRFLSECVARDRYWGYPPAAFR